jgi:pectate lyase
MKRLIQLLALAVGMLCSAHSAQAQYPYYQQALLNERVGFGRNATGGAGGEVYWVTNLNESGPGSLRQACEQDNNPRWIMFAVNGTINLSSPIQVHSYKTIDGRGASITLASRGLWIVGLNQNTGTLDGSRHVIVENLTFANGVDFTDGLMVQNGAGDVWVDHCTFSNWPYHNALDVSFPRAGIYTDVTISWCKFINQKFVMLIGDHVGDPNGANLRVTLHHNLFYQTEQRHPRIYRALVHAYNNYLYDWKDFGMASNDSAQLRTENNIFQAIRSTTAVMTEGTGYSAASNNWNLNGAVVEQRLANLVFSPANYYPYTAEPAINNNALASNIYFAAGATRTSGTLANMSTRANVQSGQGNLISGFNISGSPSDSKRVLIRAIGPSLSPYFPNAMGNPTLTIYDVYGQQIQFNDNWGDYQYSEIQATGLAPSNYLEAAWVGYLAPGTYSAAINGWGTGIAVLEIYDLQASAPAKLVNISSRATVDPNNPPFAGFIAQSGWTKLLIRGIGPSLAQFGIQNPISDPTLTLYDSNGTQIAYNNNWQDAPSGASQLGFAPSDGREAVIVTNLAPGSYTVMLRDYYNNWGVGVVELYKF